MGNKNSKFDLKLSYNILLEIGFIGALLILILLAKINLSESSGSILDITVQDEPSIVLPPTGIQEPEPVPPPPIPDVPIKIPDDSPIDVPPIEFTEYNSSTPLPLPHLEQVVKINVDHDRLKTFDLLPQMIGGKESLRKSIEYPRFALRTGIQGLVEVEFIVTKRGDVVDPVIIRGIGGGCDEAVLEGIKLQKFTPGVKDGALTNFKIKETVQFIIVGTIR
ncbi:MAG: energy transducer TonB [Balneolaceae bacterium]